MTATFEEIRAWVEGAKRSGDVRHVIIACDTYDHSNYPVFVREGEDFWEEFRKASDSGNMQKVDEVYDLSLDLLEQLAERRAFHPPARPTGALPPEDLIQHAFRSDWTGRCAQAVEDGEYWKPCGKMRALHNQMARNRDTTAALLGVREAIVDWGLTYSNGAPRSRLATTRVPRAAMLDIVDAAIARQNDGSR